MRVGILGEMDSIMNSVIKKYVSYVVSKVKDPKKALSLSSDNYCL